MKTQLVITLLAVLGHCVLINCHEHILLLGDSIDRGIQHAWCSSHNPNADAAQIDWSDATIQYGGHYGVKHCPAYCINPQTNSSVSAVHIYGSNADGPYFTSSHEISAPLVGNIRNTTYRIKSSIQQYVARFGLPTKILFNTVQWDLQGIGTHVFDMNMFKSNILGRLEDIRVAINDDSVLVGMRTAPAQVKTGRDQAIAHQMNAWIREVCMVHVAHCEVFFDYDLDLWAIENFDRTYDNHDLLFEDSAHPKPAYSAVAGEKIMQTRYSKYYRNNKVAPRILESETTGALYFVEDRHTSPPSAYPHAVRSLTSDTQGKRTLTKHHSLRRRSLQENSPPGSASESGLSDAEYSIVQNMRLTRRYVHTALPRAQLHCLRLGASDAMNTSDTDIAMLPVAGAFPAELFHLDENTGGRIAHGAVTAQAKMYLVYPHNLLERCIRVEPVANLSTLQHLLPPAAIVHHVHDMWFAELGIVPLSPAPPAPFLESFYADNTLLRVHTDKQVHVVRNMTRYTIPGVNVFFKYGWDFDQVRVITDPFILNLLPYGGDLT